MIARLSSKRRAAASPNWTANRARASTASALLTKRLLPATSNFRSGFLRFGALSSASHERDHHLMDQGFVVLSPQKRLRDFDGLIGDSDTGF